MKAALSDPVGPLLARLAPFALPLVLFALVWSHVLVGATATLLGVLAVALNVVAVLLPFRRKRLRVVELTCGPGYADVKQAGVYSQRISTEAVIGATTARTPIGVMLTLSLRGRDQPILVDVPTEDDADRVRRALGIGHAGFGSIRWRTTRTTWAHWLPLAAAVVTGLRALLLLAPDALAPAPLTEGDVGAVSFLVCAFCALLVGGGPATEASPPTVIMETDGLRLSTERGWCVVPYAEILGVDVSEGRLHVRTPPPRGSVSMQVAGGWTDLGDDDLRALVAQVLAASARARGLGPVKDNVTARVDVLQRRGASVRDWLARLDAAGQVLASPASDGYRGTSLDAEDLWGILEDPDGDVELRAGAARVLRHLTQPEVKLRIDATLATLRDERTTNALRTAVQDDLDAAADELGALDARFTPPRRCT